MVFEISFLSNLLNLSFEIDDTVTTDPLLVANRFNSFFSNVADTIRSSIPDSASDFSEYLRNSNLNSIFLIPATSEEVSKLIKKNRHHKDLLIENKNNPAKFWTVIKSLFPSRKSTESTSTTSSSKDDLLQKANNFCKYFSCCESSLKYLMFPLQNLRWKIPI